MILASCGPKPEEQVKEFAVKFGDFVNTNQKDSIQKYYPYFELTDSLVNLPVGNITVTSGNMDGVYLAEFSSETFITVKLEKDGKITILESKGILAVDSKGLDLVKNANLWNEDLNDTELRQLVVEQLRQDSIERAQKQMEAFSPSLFISKSEGWWDTKYNIYSSLKKNGFSLVQKKFVKDLIGYSDGGTSDGYKVKYSNEDIGVTVSWGIHPNSNESQISTAIEINFDNPELEHMFISKIKRMGFNKEDSYTYLSPDGFVVFINQGNGKYIIAYVS